MAEVQVGPGDSVSRLIQANARVIGLKRVWTGQAVADVRRVLMDLYNAERMKDNLWKGISELYSMPELKDLPEAFQAKLMSIILAARGNAELETKTMWPEQQSK